MITMMMMAITIQNMNTIYNASRGYGHIIKQKYLTQLLAAVNVQTNIKSTNKYYLTKLTKFALEQDMKAQM
jgi:hypothetical protein